MSLYSTEFHLTPEVDRAAFLAEVRAWAQGMRHTRLFDADAEETRDGDNIRWIAPGGESLMLRALVRDGALVSVGCRHDVPDPQGRQWRTEAVMRQTERGNLLRVRAQCLAIRPLAVTETPRRTHLIRSLIENGRVAADGPLAVQTGPHRLSADAAAQEFAARIALGTAASDLPIVYLSATSADAPILGARAVDRLAMDLCGIAHVVVEPSRAFSFGLRDLSDGRNVYGGTIGVSLPGRGFVRRLFIGPAVSDSATLAEAARQTATGLRTAMPSRGGWEWHDLQDGVLAEQRRRERGTLSQAENEALWLEEVQAKDDRIRELEARVESLSRAAQEAPGSELASSPLPGLAIPEIWRGEFADRLRAALAFCVEKGADAGWDDRSLAVFGEWLAQEPLPSDMDELRQALKTAGRDAKKFNKSMKALLLRHGFVDKSDNKHSRMEPRPDFPGLQSVTLMKTPGEGRGLGNAVSQIEGHLGITRLKQVR